MGERFMAINGGPNKLLESAGPISLVAACDTQEEIDRLWNAFSDGGKPIACGWITDKFGVTWQVVPAVMGELMGDPDPIKAKRVADAMMKWLSSTLLRSRRPAMPRRSMPLIT